MSRKYLKFKSFIICFALASLAFSHTTFSSNYTSVHDFLANQKHIRILIDDATGYGSQAASTELTVKLRERGFKGQYEVIYSTRVLNKITTLFDLPDNLPSIYYDAKRNIYFITIQEFVNRHKKKTAKKIFLGMTGVLDNRPSGIAYRDGIDVIHGIDQIDYVNYANFMDVNVFAQLTTFYKYTNYIFIANNPDYLTYPQKGSTNKFITTKVASLAEVKKYSQKNYGILDFIHAMENHTYNILPVYGITLKADCKNEYKASGCFPGNILQVIAAARYAQLYGPEPFHKPLIIAVYYDYKKEANILLQMIKSFQWHDYEIPGAENVRHSIRNLKLADHFYIANSADKTQKIYSQLKNDDVLLLWLGPLPKKIFDGLYNHTDTNIWAPIREGNNSFSSIILTGRPHFRCGKNWELGTQGMNDALKNQFSLLYNESGFCRGMTTWHNNEKIYKILGKLLIEANDPNSSLSHYFLNMKKIVSDPKNDRLNFLLEEIVRIANLA